MAVAILLILNFIGIMLPSVILIIIRLRKLMTLVVNLDILSSEADVIYIYLLPFLVILRFFAH